MIAYLMPVILCLTVIAAVGLGIVAAYAAIITILQAFGSASRAASQPVAARLVLVPSQNHASGD